MNAISSYRGNSHTSKQTNIQKQTNPQTGPITIHCAANLSAQCIEKSAHRRRKHCVLAVVRRSQNFRPAADPFSGGAGRPKFNQLEMVTTFTYKPSLVKEDRSRNFELSWLLTHKQTNIQRRLQYTALQLSVQCNNQCSYVE